ncbi:MAG: hypothetical protein H6825_13975 [Planctomycetes bacterium]|nr:hypothetical protein [Planctomycetota bacterium]
MILSRPSVIVLCAALCAPVSLAFGPTASLASTQDAAKAPDEKGLREAFHSAYLSRLPEDRALAVTTFDEATRALPDGGSSRLVAKTLAEALDDESFTVRVPALRALSWGRHVDTVLDVLPKFLDDLRDDIEKLSTRPDEASRNRMRDTIVLYGEGAKALATHADDRVVDYLAGEIRTLRPSGSSTNIYSLRMIVPLADALLMLGSREAVEAVVKATASFGGGEMRWDNVKKAAGELHESLARFAESKGDAAPTFDDFYDQSWHTWYEKHEDELPKKLGKLKQPTERPAYEPEDRVPDRAGPGRVERP